MTVDRVEVSEREVEVLVALRDHLSNARIASRLHISVRTVEGHVSSLLRKYGVADRRELAALAVTVADGTGPAVGQLAGIPIARTTFIGRGEERDGLVAALQDSRLVTLLGPGGVGKTRLAAAVAEAAASSFPFGGAFVDLVPVRDGFVAQAVATTLGVSEGPQLPLVNAIIERLARGRSLLILDNCEHLLEAAAAFVDRVLSACPTVTVLTTSRERLGLPGERGVPVAPLPLGSDAETLFCQRIETADPGARCDPDVVADLCSRLDGLPLAIELAAARCASLGAAGLLAGLGDYLRLLAGGRGTAVRHRSLRAVIDWSHDLLDDEERTMFRRLSVFSGDFDLEAVTAVAANGDPAAAADILGRLVDKSLVTGRAGRWRLLATVHAFAAEQLGHSAEGAVARGRYLDWAATTADALQNRLDQRWHEDFDAVADDLRAALRGCPPGPDSMAHRLARALGQLTFARRFLTESIDHYQTAARHARTPADAARDLWTAANCTSARYAGQPAFELLLAAAEQARTAGDASMHAILLAAAVTMATRNTGCFDVEVPHDRLRRLLDQATAEGDPRDAVVAAHLAAAAAWITDSRKYSPDPVLAETAVTAARATGDPVLLSAALDGVVAAARAAGRHRDAHRVNGERLALLPLMSRHDPRAAPEILDTYQAAPSIALEIGDLATALSAAQLAMDDDVVGDSCLSAAKLIPPLVLSGHFAPALHLADSVWDRWTRDGRPVLGELSPAMAAIALVHGLCGDVPKSELWRARASQVRGSVVLTHSTFLTFVEARLGVHTGRYDGVEPLLTLAFTDAPCGTSAYARAAAAELAVVLGLPDAAEYVTAAARTAPENDWVTACLDRAAGRLHGDIAALTAAVSGWERIGARYERACTLLLIPGREVTGRNELASLCRDT
ncbi:LuxR C-terminal-related transcriptional regulator [Micromonospora phytophila]|uniref:ATP-binding protein n=1 Tax=Micromonospora phytophila TaxID=709888 RepID=UPI00202E35C4|nr:LuxR C-terminal-related transcriptional regulator [Micromonospora phytophila]MCM0677545.1 LuxR C-terminal-related transcriptional regulator [Micromonospora phytophila]